MMGPEEVKEFISSAKRSQYTDEETGLTIVIFYKPDGRILVYDTLLYDSEDGPAPS